MKRGALILALALWATTARAGAEEPRPDWEVWNEAVDLYRAGDATNALETLRPLMLSKSHGARAAELVAKLEYDAARKPGAQDALKHLEEAAAAAQIALRADPGGKRANDNFTRAVDGLPELREAKRVESVLAAAKGKDPSAILGDAVREIRAVAQGASTYRTNEARRAVAEADSLSARTSRLADAWLTVKELVRASVTNEADAATIASRVDGAREKTKDAALLLGYMDPEAGYKLAEIEQDFTDFFKMAVLPPQAARIDLGCQSNAWMDVEAEYGRPWQNEALDYTRAFRAKFPSWADAYAAMAQADTNKPPFSAEARKEVEALSERLEGLQTVCVKEALPPTQEECVRIIERIIELLPDDPPQGGAGQPQGGQNQQSGQGNGDDKKKQDDGGDGKEPPQTAPEDSGGDGKTPEDEDGKDGDAADGDEGKTQDDREIEAVLKKAQERNDEHEERKKARARRVRLPPNERDW